MKRNTAPARPAPFNLLSGPVTGKVLSYVASLPMQEGHSVKHSYEVTGRIPQNHLSKFLDFLAEKSA